MPFQKKRLYICLLALALGAACILLTFLLPPTSKAANVFFDRSSAYYPFTIQNVMWIFFFVCLGEIYHRFLFTLANKRGLRSGYLSEQPDVFYDMEDLIDIRKKTHDKTDLVASLINILTIRYQISHKDVSETHQMLNSQLELLQFKMDVDYNMVRYICWLIPSLGFIGTVVGISNTLAAAGIPGAADKSDFLTILTTNLAFAFDTTLVALIMSAFLVYLMHLVQGMEERIVERCGNYCLNNLINKLISKLDGGV